MFSNPHNSEARHGKTLQCPKNNRRKKTKHNMFSSKRHIRVNCGVNTMFSAKNTHSRLGHATFLNKLPRVNETWMDMSSKIVDETTKATQQAFIAVSVLVGACHTIIIVYHNLIDAQHLFFAFSSW